MSAIVCGKRSAFEESTVEVFHPTSRSAFDESIYVPLPPVTKRARWLQPSSASIGVGGRGGSLAEKVVLLRSMFGGVEEQVVHQVLEACNHDIDSAIQSLKGLRIIAADNAALTQAQPADPSAARAADQLSPASGQAQPLQETLPGQAASASALELTAAEALAAAAAAAAAGGGGGAAAAAGTEEQETPEGDLTESLIHMQACKALLVMATNGAADLIIEHVPGVMGALERLRQESGVEEAVVQADAALMSLWLSPKGYALSNPELRPVVVGHLLRVLGSPDLVDNHQDVSLALVTSTINPDAATRASMLQLYSGLLTQQLELTHILIGHVDDTDSLAHQSVVYFVLHICESEDCAKSFTANQTDCEALVAALVVAAQAENHYAPIAVLVRLASRPSTRDHVLTHIDTRTLNRLRAIPGTRARREVVQLATAFAEYKGEKVDPPERTASMPTEEEESKEDILRDIVRSQSTRSLKARAGGSSCEDLSGAVASVATGVAKITVDVADA